MTTLKTRKPTATPTWPIVLLAHRPQAGGTRAALGPSTSPLIGDTYYVPFGVDEPDEFAAVADFHIVEHDGRVADLLDAIDAVNAQPDTDSKPSLLIVDSVSPLWATIWEDGRIAASRAKGKRDEEELNVWDETGRVWREFTNRIRAHRGPVILTARLQAVELMDGFKIDAHKNLPHDVQAIVELPQPGEFVLRGIKAPTANLSLPLNYPDLTVEKLWEHFGIRPGVEVAHRAHRSALPLSDGRRDLSGRDWRAELAAAGENVQTVAALGAAANAAGADGPILKAIRDRHQALIASTQ